MSTTSKREFAHPFNRGEDASYDIKALATQLEELGQKYMSLFRIVKKFNDDNQILRRLRNQVAQVVARGSLVPTCVFFKQPPEDGMLLRYFFVSPAKLRQGGVYIGTGPKGEYAVRMKLTDRSGVEHSMREVFKPGYNAFDVNMRVEVGSVLEVTMDGTWPAGVADIWLGFVSEVFLCAK